MAAIILNMLLIGGATDVEPDEHCGAYCLFVSLAALDTRVGTFNELERQLGAPGRGGYSLGQLADFAESKGLSTLGVVTNVDNLQRREGPFTCIAKVDDHHFVNIAGVGDGRVQVIDPPREYAIPIPTFAARWDGTALLIARNPLVREEDLPSGNSTSQWASVFWVMLSIACAGALAIAWRLARAKGGA
ncbi:MAG TPA: cysteine peptidase family C39 domain-containing protein [Pirellulales bacterium]|nr:cysteine peptidase family C39 domain-containing protein [Pirellulales bacterium]